MDNVKGTGMAESEVKEFTDACDSYEQEKLKELAANEEAVYQRVRYLGWFARSVLSRSFPALDLVNPSFTVLAKACEFLAALLRSEASSGMEHASDLEELAEYMRDIAEAIVDRDDKALVDSMAILDEFLEGLQRRRKERDANKDADNVVLLN
ncbi:hypothetical protein [Vibrio harveyi]